jgi:hypothetical protein
VGAEEVRRGVAVVVIIGVAYLGFHFYQRSNGPDRAYEAFAEEMLHHRYDRAATMADGLSADDLSKIGGLDPAMLQTLFPSKFKIETREKAPDGTITLGAVQTVLFNPPGVESAVRPAMYATMNQTVSLRKGSAGWKITAFDNKVARMDSLTSR